VQLEYILDDRAPDLARENIDVSASVWLPQNKLLVVRDLFRSAASLPHRRGT
jgi:hypothetical protein